MAYRLDFYTKQGVTLLSDAAHRVVTPGKVAFAFTTRQYGVSTGPYEGLNLGMHTGDDPACVEKNRELVLEAMGIVNPLQELVVPKQVHGTDCVVFDAAAPQSWEEARAHALAGADAIVTNTAGIPVLLCFADCVPVVLVVDNPAGFAVIHSGWKGTLGQISASALAELCALCKVDPREVRAFIGPHIAAQDYEVSFDLIGRFEVVFGARCEPFPSHLDLSACIKKTLTDAGVLPERIVSYDASVTANPYLFYSYRASEGVCGRHGALAYICPSHRQINAAQFAGIPGIVSNPHDAKGVAAATQINTKEV